MSQLNSDWPHGGERPIPRKLGPSANSDSDSGHQPEEDPEDTSAQDPAVLSLGPRHVDTSWPGLRTLLQQLPPQDSDEHYCLALGEEELTELRLFSAQRRQEALGQGMARLVPPKLKGYTCEKCKEQLRPGEYAVFAALAGERRGWHGPCFTCQACGQTLINFIYFHHDGHLYCGRHQAELLRPRCPACDQLIFSQRCIEAEGRRWHENHFCCQDCDGPLGGGRYALPGGGPCCPRCFNSRYADEGCSPGPTLEGRAPLALPSPPHPQTEASGPAALTAHPWPERFKGLPNPPGAEVRAAAPDLVLGGVRGRPLLGGGGRLRSDRCWLRGMPHPQLWERETPGSELLTPPGAGEAGPNRGEGKYCVLLNAVPVFRAALLPAVAVSSPKTQRRRSGSSSKQECRAADVIETPKEWAQSVLEMPPDPEEDALGPASSSSSDSEPEGFFLGQRLPWPGETAVSYQAGDSDTSRKSCLIC